MTDKLEPLKKEDFVRGVIVNADEYKSDEIISQNKIEEVWVNTENLKSALEFYKSYKDKPHKLKIEHLDIFRHWNIEQKFNDFLLDKSFEDAMK